MARRLLLCVVVVSALACREVDVRPGLLHVVQFDREGNLSHDGVRWYDAEKHSVDYAGMRDLLGHLRAQPGATFRRGVDGRRACEVVDGILRMRADRYVEWHYPWTFLDLCRGVEPAFWNLEFEVGGLPGRTGERLALAYAPKAAPGAREDAALGQELEIKFVCMLFGEFEYIGPDGGAGEWVLHGHQIRWSVGDRKVETRAALHALIASTMRDASGPSVRVILSVGYGVLFGDVMDTLGAIRDAGIEDITFAARDPAAALRYRLRRGGG